MLFFLKSLLYSFEQLLLLSKIMEKKINWGSMKVMVTILIGLCSSYLCSFSIFSYMRAFLFVLFLIFCVLYLFGVSLSKALGIVFLDFFSNMLMEIVVVVAALPFVGNDGITNDFVSILLQFLIFLGVYIIWNFHIFRRIRDNLLISPPIPFLFFSILFLCGSSIFVIFSLFENLSILGGLLFSFIVLLFWGVSFYSFFIERMEYTEVLKKYELLLETVDNYEKLLEEERMIHHEHKNQWLVLRSLVNEKEAKSYIDTILEEEVGKVNSDYASNLSVLPFQGMGGLFYCKYFTAEKLGVHLNLEVGKSVLEFQSKNYSMKKVSALLKVIGVFLDNALEAAVDSTLKEVDVTIYGNDNILSIAIANSFSSQIDLSGGIVRTTTKGKNHGYGLLLVQKLLKEYKFMKNKTEIISNVFIQTIEVDLKSVENG